MGTGQYVSTRQQAGCNILNTSIARMQTFYLDTHVMVLSSADSLAPHAHLATQLTISLGGAARWMVNGRSIDASAVYIDSGVEHHCLTAGDYLTFLFMKTSDYAHCAQRRFLQGQDFAVLDESASREMRILVEQFAQDPQALSDSVLRACGFCSEAGPHYDERIRDALGALERMDAIPADAPKLLSSEACLSQSRFSHLFKQETGMTLASYLAFLKLRKAYQGLRDGKSITQAAMDAGFSSPSHCAASCTRMFGISLKSVSAQ